MTPSELQRVKQRFSIIGNSEGLDRAIERAVKVAPIDLSVLVTGESGTGKEFFPKIIHQSGARKHRKYIAVNCGAIPEGTIDSELFGHEKGAFTGAVSTRKGYFEEADGGTIFLDEVAELPLTTQARLLRVLETGEFLKVGSSVVQKTDVRIVAATNVDLLEAVAAGRFREDLYYRLSTVVIDVPPLHDRGDDVELLARKFAADFSEKYMTPPITFSAEARRMLRLYRWPGNVRQLKNVVEQLSLFEAGTEISRFTLMETLPEDRSPLATPARTSSPAGGSPESERQLMWQMIMTMRREIDELRARLGDDSRQTPRPMRALPSASDLLRPDSADEETARRAPEPAAAHASTLEEAEREVVAGALERNNGDKKRAAEELNISPRTLYRKIKEYGL
ncbi:MAG: sigma-54 dependent transcriptional regulator [Muribaculaceae bacterium]|nr:sigma-54 dependent transcriptional regulator [Muribaculaceae bacterium]